MQKWAFMGPQWGPIVGWGLGLGLIVRAQAHRGLGHGPRTSAHSWALMKPKGGFPSLAARPDSGIVSFWYYVMTLWRLASVVDSCTDCAIWVAGVASNNGCIVVLELSAISSEYHRGQINCLLLCPTWWYLLHFIGAFIFAWTSSKPEGSCLVLEAGIVDTLSICWTDWRGCNISSWLHSGVGSSGYCVMTAWRVASVIAIDSCVDCIIEVAGAASGIGWIVERSAISSECRRGQINDLLLWPTWLHLLHFAAAIIAASTSSKPEGSRLVLEAGIVDSLSISWTNRRGCNIGSCGCWDLFKC